MTNTFNVQLVFPMSSRGIEHSDIMDTLAWMSGADQPDEPDAYDKAVRVNEVMVREMPFEVYVDGEPFSTVDRVSTDGIVACLYLPDATLPDERLEDLADVEDRVEAADWAVRNNEWHLFVHPFGDYLDLGPDGLWTRDSREWA